MAAPTAGPLYLDTNALIAIVETADRLSAGQIAFLSAVESGSLAAVSSDLALAECLVRPFAQGDAAGAAAMVGLFDSGAFAVALLNRETLIEAARQRVLHRMKLPDAMHVAVAIVTGCTGFVTADLGIRLPDPIRRVDWNGLAFPGPEG